MLNFRVNLRILATIVACFAVTTMFASCDKDGDGGDDGGGEINEKLIGTWNIGASMLQVRKAHKGVSGDAKIFNIGVTGASYTFYDDGKYTHIAITGTTVAAIGTGVLIITEGKYSVSNGVIKFKNRVSRGTHSHNIPFEWEQTSNLPDESHSFEFGYDENWEQDYLYFDESDAGYYRADDL